MPPPCDEFTTSEPSRSATRVRPPGTRFTVLPDSTYGRRSTWRGARPLSTNVGQVDSASVGCAMYLSGRREDARAECVALGRGRRRADQHPVAAGAVHLLDDELREMREHVVAILVPVQQVGRHVVEHRLLGQVEADHLRHVRDRSTCRRRRRCRSRWRASRGRRDRRRRGPARRASNPGETRADRGNRRRRGGRSRGRAAGPCVVRM